MCDFRIYWVRLFDATVLPNASYIRTLCVFISSLIYIVGWCAAAWCVIPSLSLIFVNLVLDYSYVSELFQRSSSLDTFQKNIQKHIKKYCINCRMRIRGIVYQCVLISKHSTSHQDYICIFVIIVCSIGSIINNVVRHSLHFGTNQHLNTWI